MILDNLQLALLIVHNQFGIHVGRFLGDQAVLQRPLALANDQGVFYLRPSPNSFPIFTTFPLRK